jgi:hypothetical protein
VHRPGRGIAYVSFAQLSALSCWISCSPQTCCSIRWSSPSLVSVRLAPFALSNSYVRPLRSRSNQHHVLCADPYHNVDQYQSAAPLTRSHLPSIRKFLHCTYCNICQTLGRNLGEPGFWEARLIAETKELRLEPWWVTPEATDFSGRKLRFRLDT